MASIRASLPHKNRTVKEPRQNEIHPVVLSEIEQVNHDIKVFKLSILNKEKGVKVSKKDLVSAQDLFLYTSISDLVKRTWEYLCRLDSVSQIPRTQIDFKRDGLEQKKMLFFVIPGCDFRGEL